MKIKKYLTGILTIVLVFTLTGCFSKDKIDSKKLIEFAKEDKLNVYSSTDSFKSYEDLKESYALINLKGWKIDFFEFKSSDSAEKIFDEEKEKIKKNKDKNSEEDTSGVRNYKTYELTTKTNYYYISRVDNTLLIVISHITNKKDINKFIKKINY